MTGKLQFFQKPSNTGAVHNCPKYAYEKQSSVATPVCEGIDSEEDEEFVEFNLSEHLE